VRQILNCCFEPLETRTLLSSVHLSGKLLNVIGSGSQPNTITVGLSSDEQSVDVSVSFPAAHGQTKLLTGTYPITSIRAIFITGGSKADYIAIDQTNGSFPLPTKILAGGGNDTVYGGDEPDSVMGGGGNDYISGGGGNDSLWGQAGRDTLIGGAGDDQLHGCAGDDSLEGDDGNDTLFDAQGPDTMLGGAGNNVFSIRGLHGDPDNDFNKDTDKLRIVVFPSNDSSFWSDVLNSYLY
jgi:Ca2+-binding RTX toxin-like protein